MLVTDGAKHDTKRTWRTRLRRLRSPTEVSLSLLEDVFYCNNLGKDERRSPICVRGAVNLQNIGDCLQEVIVSFVGYQQLGRILQDIGTGQTISLAGERVTEVIRKDYTLWRREHESVKDLVERQLPFVLLVDEQIPASLNDALARIYYHVEVTLVRSSVLFPRCTTRKHVSVIEEWPLLPSTGQTQSRVLPTKVGVRVSMDQKYLKIGSHVRLDVAMTNKKGCIQTGMTIACELLEQVTVFDAPTSTTAATDKKVTGETCKSWQLHSRITPGPPSETSRPDEQRFSVDLVTPTVLCADHTSTNLEVIHWISVRMTQNVHKQVVHETFVFPLIFFARASSKVLPPYVATGLGVCQSTGHGLESAVIFKDTVESRALPEYSLGTNQKADSITV